jgi:glutamate--cysteine ligase
MDPAAVISREEDLLERFRLGAKPRERWGVGIEYERLGVFRDTGRAIPYDGPASVEALLKAMVQQRDWTPHLEDGRILSLTRGHTSVTLEPGGQMELSGAVHPDLGGAKRELREFVTEVEELSRPLGIAWLGVGSHPLTSLDQISWIPKRRYAIMRDYLPTRGTLAHAMMQSTACIQINVDYHDEVDAFDKLRIAMGLSPLLTAVYANSPLTEGRRNGFMSYRAWIWRHTDPDRCGLLPFVFHENVGFADYLEYALDVPMFFVVRDHRYLPAGRTTFRTFIREGFQGARATHGDFQLHLTTLFPEVRMKEYIEMRGCDSGSPEACLALAAFWKGVLYDDAALAAAWQLVRDMTFEERDALLVRVCREGPAARVRDRGDSRRGSGVEKVRDLLVELLRQARLGLERQGVSEEAAFLDPLDRQLDEEGACPAYRLTEDWDGPLRHDPRRLVDALSGEAARAT